MATGLGHGVANSIIFNARNNLPSNALVKGQIVEIEAAAIVFADGLDADPIFDIVLVTGGDGTAGEGGLAAGVVKETIPAGEVGQVIVYGLAKVVGNGALAVGTVLTSVAGGVFQNAAGATHESASAVLLETISAADATGAVPRWAFVDFIGNSCHGIHSAGDTFHGIAY